MRVKKYDLKLILEILGIEKFAPYDAFVVTVKHDIFKTNIGLNEFFKLSKNKSPVILIDVKRVYPREEAHSCGFLYWRF